MSKRNKTQSADAVCKEGVASTVGGAIDAINEAAKELGDLPYSRDYGRIDGIVRSIADCADRELGRACSDAERMRVMEAFSVAVGNLHNIVCRREEWQLRLSMGEVDFHKPFTHRIGSRCEWDLVDGSWEDPKFKGLRGFATLEGRTPPGRGCPARERTRRFARAWLAAMMEETDALSHMSRRRAGDALPRILRKATEGYGGFREYSIFCGIDAVAAPQFILAYLRTLERLIGIAAQSGTRGIVASGLPFSASATFDELFWFVMPELPASDDPLGAADFIEECVAEIEWRTRSFDSLAPDLFVEWSFHAACCLETCVRKSLAIAAPCRNNDDLLFAVSDVLERIRGAIERSDEADYLPRRPTISGISYDSVPTDWAVAGLRRLTHCALRIKDEDVIRSMPTRLRECMWVFTRAANSEAADMEKLVCTLGDSLNKMATRVNRLCYGSVR